MNKKPLKVFSIGAILGSMMQVGMPISAEAAVDSYIIKVSQEVYSYNKNQLNEDFLNFKAGETSKLYNDFVIKLKMANGFYAFHDKKTGYIKYEEIEKKYLESKLENKKFNIERFTESKECKIIEVNWTKKAIVTIEGSVKYITPTNVIVDNNSTSNKVKDDKNLNDKDNENSNINNEDNNKVSEGTSEVSKQSSFITKHKHKHNSKESTSKIEVEKNKAEKEKLGKIEADKQKSEVEKQKADELKKQQELKKQEEAERQRVEKEKQEKLAEEKAKTEKEKLARIEADKQKSEVEKQKADELKKQQELKKQEEAERQRVEKEKQEKLAEEKAKTEKEKLARIEADKQKSEVEKQKADELKKQQELKKQEEAERQRVEKEKQEKLAGEKAKAEKEKLARIEENNKLIEEAKNNIKLEDLSNVKDNLRLPTKDVNGVGILWKSSDESVIKNDGTVTRPNADEADKKVTLIATFTKDSATSTKEFEAIVKAQEKLPVKTEEEEIAESLKGDKKIELNQPEQFDKVVKEAVKQLKSNFTVVVPYSEYKKYNFNNFNNIMVELGGQDYGKPGVRTGGGSVSIINDKIPITVHLSYRRDVDEVKNQRQATEAAVKRIVKEVVKDDMTSVEKELALHDYVVKHADYNMEGLKKNPADLEDHSAYGVLVLGKGVCESYAKAMHLLLNEAGIECKYATGYKKNKDGSQGGGHAWNIVKLDNEWYNLDATWDDPVSDRVGRSDKDVVVSPVIHTYFNVTDDIFDKDHIRGEYEQKNYPKANGTKYSYDNLDVDEFMNDGTKVPKVTSKEELIEQVKEAMKNKKTVLYVRLKGLKMTQQELMNELGKVLDGNIYKSYGVSPTDESHAYCNFILR
ncbi:transglutaminase-like domain-containing protein [Clostridium botulinum]|uniref:transglutaminase-like domain-containing protein n=1 Tax=Clostridium botulinum TaxID=1491 RepID=UPI001E31BFC8|nr:transglutaminase-like domain-containing protein [Clostridium botulinum]MCD3340971.1 transglutaminase [Clostridium botulinum D/C]MCD3359225.1 transglutaminase [Clostridium botulinum D/C]MCD3364920.1 transglutaminase [Clostridium botulinum D/C]